MALGSLRSPDRTPRMMEPGQCNLVKGRSLLADWDPASAALPVGVEEWLEEQAAEDERALTLLAHLERLALDFAMRAAPRRTAVLAEWAALTDSGRSEAPPAPRLRCRPRDGADVDPLGPARTRQSAAPAARVWSGAADRRGAARLTSRFLHLGIASRLAPWRLTTLAAESTSRPSCSAAWYSPLSASPSGCRELLPASLAAGVVIAPHIPSLNVNTPQRSLSHRAAARLLVLIAAVLQLLLSETTGRTA